MLCIVVLTLVACSATRSGGGGAWPAAIGWPAQDGLPLRVLDNDGFALGYDTAAGRAAWVAYRVRPVAHYRPMPRPSFQPDPRLATRGEPRVYAGPAYDRGHLAPNYAISQLYGEKAQRQTFFYSNIVPQRARLNQLLWQRLEEIEIDEIAAHTHNLWVFAGPVPGPVGAPPAAFYRIWYARGHGNDAWQALAFLVPQQVRGDERLDRFIVSIDRIEALTGLDFMASRSPAQQRRIESSAASPARFGFAEFACQPARYDRRWRHRDGIRLRYDRCGGR